MRAFLGLLFGICICLSLTWFAGENPVTVASILFKSAFGSRYDLGLTLFYSTSLIFTGLSVAMAFHSGLFNIGAEGQLTIAALCVAVFGIVFSDLPAPFSILCALLVAILSGGLWGGIAGYLKAKRGSHEVIVTMMLNFIAAGIASWVTLERFRNPDSQNPETVAIGKSYVLKSVDPISLLFVDSPANWSFLLALFCSVGVYWLLFKTKMGFQIRASGFSPRASEFSGINSQRMKILAMILSGALAGFVSINEVLGSSERFKIGFSPEFGFVGIAVALLARNNPIGILASAFLFGALQKGATDLDFETDHITRDFARVIQAIIILSVAAFYFFDFSRLKGKLKWIKK